MPAAQLQAVLVTTCFPVASGSYIFINSHPFLRGGGDPHNSLIAVLYFGIAVAKEHLALCWPGYTSETNPDCMISIYSEVCQAAFWLKDTVIQYKLYSILPQVVNSL